MPPGQEEVVGRGVLDRWIFCKYGRQARRRGDDRNVRQESGTRISAATFGFSARAVLNTPPLWGGDFYFSPLDSN